MTLLASLAARFLGPRIIAAVPWRLIAVLALLAGLAAFLWGVERHGEAKQRAADAPVIAGLRTDLASVKAAQIAANKAAAANKARVETAQAATTGKDDHANDAALTGIRADYAALRLRYAALARRGQPGAVSGVPSPASSPVCPAGADAAIPAAQLVDFAEQGDEWRQRLADIKAWYADQATIAHSAQPQ